MSDDHRHPDPALTAMHTKTPATTLGIVGEVTDGRAGNEGRR